MREATLERRCGAFVRREGGWSLKLWPTVSGLPDRLVLMPVGRVYFVEFKTLTGRVSPIQKRVHGLLARLGFPVFVVRTFGQFTDMLDR